MFKTLLRTQATFLTAAVVVAVMTGCAATLPTDSEGAMNTVTDDTRASAIASESDEPVRPAGWTEASHSNDVDPNYDVVFPADVVNTLTITIAPEDWATMQADMEDIYAPSLYIREGMLAADPNLTKEERDQLFLELFREKAAERTANAAPVTATEPVTATNALTSSGVLTAAVAAPPVEQIATNRSPIWVPATIGFQGQEWTHVGVRYKGASSLSPYLFGDLRLPFKFDFDQFEDDYPEIDNQRFFGFKQLSLANNYDDPAGMRDTLVYEVLAETGLPSLRTAPVEVTLDYGEGPVRLGLYTMIEVVDDTGIPSQFGNDDGNIYEGEGFGVSLAPETSHLLEDSFEKKNNEDKEDWSDIWALYDTLNSEQRTTDPAAWRADLEALFDVDGFLEWLGVAAVVGHADTYGNAYHNFYIYNNPETGKLTWVSWDHNMTFIDFLRPTLTLDKANVTDVWPLIRYLLDDPVYRARYVELLAENYAGALAPDALIAKARAHAELIAPVATQDMSAEEYDAAVQAIVDFVEARAAEVEAFLAAQATESAPATSDGTLGQAAAPAADESNRPAGWTEASHSNDVDPNYDVVFPIDAVNTITITIAPDDWTAMQANMEELFGEERDNAQALAEMTDEERTAYLQQRIEAALAAGEQAPLGAEFTRPSPMWVPATISFQGRDWTHVGVRYKGASSLSPWMTGDLRLPFKFDFDEFEDDYPEINNQRFFGFKELSLANNYEDPAGMRDTLVYEILAEAGLPSVRTAPVEIVLDYGEGPMRLGLYTMIEVVDETGISAYFGNDDGNIYEANGFGTSLAKANDAEAIEASFEKKNNEDAADWSDILALYDVLHDEKRTGEPEAWRADLEAIFDVDAFLEWLGIAAVVGHGDTYGFAGHNFYIYNNPETGKLTWVSWDHNVTFRDSLLPFLVLDKSIVTEAWPLIRFLLDDPVYWAHYVELMAENYAGVLAKDALITRVQEHAELIAPVATSDMSAEEYDAAVQEIIDFVETRAAEVEAFLAAQK